MKLFTNLGGTLLLLLAILVGSLVGGFAPKLGESLFGWSDSTILLLVFLLLFEVRFRKLSKAGQHWRFLLLAWVTNFLLIPPLGFAVASLFFSGQPLFLMGLAIYFMAPCTDWFLGFTRMARGNTALGAILLPINMATQLLLYPVYLALFLRQGTGFTGGEIASTLWSWFVVPAGSAVIARLVLQRFLPERAFEQLLTVLGKAIPLVLAALVLFIFAGNIGTILDHGSVFLWILLAVFLFFVLTWLLSEGLSRLFKLEYGEHALLTMTAAARNAPLMLGVTAAVFPDQPLVYAALIIGMLVEFPHLTALKHLLLRSREESSSDTGCATAPDDQPATA